MKIERFLHDNPEFCAVRVKDLDALEGTKYVGELSEARRLLARSIPAIKLGEMDFIKEVYAFLERSKCEGDKG